MLEHESIEKTKKRNVAIQMCFVLKAKAMDVKPADLAG